MDDFELVMAQRQDVIIDFRNAPDEVYLENIMVQEDGRKPKEVDPSRAVPLLKFVVEGPPVPNDVTVEPGTPLRPFVPIREDEIAATRTFRFDRSNGAFTVNNRFFNSRRTDAVPQLETAERWILENNSGGWWHPIHMHLEHHQVQTIDGRPPPFHRRFRVDTTNLRGGDRAEILMNFRTFTGPFVFHCHNLEHEDMRMMAGFDPRPAGEETPLDGESEIDPVVSGVVSPCEELDHDERLLACRLGAGGGGGGPRCADQDDLLLSGSGAFDRGQDTPTGFAR